MDIAKLRAEADRCRRLARAINDEALAAELERFARDLERRINFLADIPDPDKPAIA
jgi:hypothetical protein